MARGFAGNFRFPVRFQSAGSAVDAYGQRLPNYTDVVTVGGDVGTATTREIERAGLQTDQADVRVYARYTPTLDALGGEDRMIIRGITYDIVGKDLMDFENRTIMFLGRALR